MAGQDVFGFVGAMLENRYRVESVVGEGGFGVVYRGENVNLGGAVAIKCLKTPPHFSGEARTVFVERFRAEARLLRQLGERHGSFVKVHDFGVVDARGVVVPYIVLEWLEGLPLDAALRRRWEAKQAPFSEREAVALLRPALEALAVAHGGGSGQVIAHRDIKPENLFVVPRPGGPFVKVLDLGIAKAMQEGDARSRLTNHTSSNFHAFSPLYGAPEQFRAKKYGETGPWTDVHAVGLVLSELVTGTRALEGEEFGDLMEAATAAERPTPRRLGARVSDGFEAVCEKALSVSSKERYRGAGELLAALDEVLAARVVVGTVAAAVPAPAAQREPARPAEKQGVARAAVETKLRVGTVVGEEAGGGEERAVSKGGAVGTELVGIRTGLREEEDKGEEQPGEKRGRSRVMVLAGAGVVALGLVGLALSRRGPSAETPVASSGAAVSASVSASAGGRSSAPSASAEPAARVVTAEEAKLIELGLKPPAKGPTGEARAGSGAMVKIEGGTFTMGDKDAGPAHPVKVETFWMDETEVTVGAYQACVEGGVCTTTNVETGGLCNWGKRSERGKHPMNCVDWEQAKKYCEWANKRLPTEEEWEYAARPGGSKGDRYPWGNEEPKNQLCWDGEGNDLGKGKRMSTCPVGSYPAGNTSTGLKDMAGNVWEWTSSQYCNYSASGYDISACISDRRVDRGGGFVNCDPAGVRGAVRDYDAASYRDFNVGFRCARAHLLLHFTPAGDACFYMCFVVSW